MPYVCIVLVRDIVCYNQGIGGLCVCSIGGYASTVLTPSVATILSPSPTSCVIIVHWNTLAINKGIIKTSKVWNKSGVRKVSKSWSNNRQNVRGFGNFNYLHSLSEAELKIFCHHKSLTQSRARQKRNRRYSQIRWGEGVLVTQGN